MSARRRVTPLVAGLVGLALCLAGGGCTLQVGYGDQSTKPPPSQPVSHSTAKPFDNGPLGAPILGGNAMPVLPPPPGAYGPLNGPPLAGNLPPAPGAPDGPQLAPDRGMIPGELHMRSHPPYVVEPPDILVIDTIRMVPKAPYTIAALDVLLIRLAEPLPGQPIDGPYTVGPDGSVGLGFAYGAVMLGGKTLAEAERVIIHRLKQAGLNAPRISISLAQYRGVQQARGTHLVRQDGTISLGTYGCVYVTGLTLAQVKVAIERHLAQYVCEAEVTVDVLAYNSKYYYVIADGAGFGQQVYRFPIVGKETVLDAINNIGGIPPVNSIRRMWVARPAPPEAGCTQVLPVDWLAITQGGATGTNYQLFPGDRVYIASDCLIMTDNVLSKVFSPIQRIFGTAFLGSSLFRSFNSNNGNGNNGGGGIGFIAPLR